MGGTAVVGWGGVVGASEMGFFFVFFSVFKEMLELLFRCQEKELSASDAPRCLASGESHTHVRRASEQHSPSSCLLKLPNTS